MSRLIAILAFASAAVAMPIATAGPASADDKITILDCTIRGGAVLPNSSSPTHLRCLGGLYHGAPVFGVL
ncbi:hypothetical protein [Nonomuraea jiangxiensis]|uniref:Uncharacterized protein n=1 Tax=Nonomuraea jiangxiensis TaxID=633440 RepID=A0A1G9C6A5_9ACTN|nr:hypothetical protein [Nonomuraea jiangxiensis]SDK47202.1 hypothetical protein SAMN05421869_11686 [Nonomuraea jiangxiensis]